MNTQTHTHTHTLSTHTVCERTGAVTDCKLDICGLYPLLSVFRVFCVFTPERVSCVNLLPEFSFKVYGDHIKPHTAHAGKMELVSISNGQRRSCTVLLHGSRAEHACSVHVLIC